MMVLVLSFLSILAPQPIRTQTFFRQLHGIQVRRVALDNAAIRLGQHDRQLLNRSLVGEATLHQLHLAYHVARVCALAPSPIPACVASMKALHVTIQASFRSLTAGLKAQWPMGLLLAGAEARKLGVVLCGMNRPSQLPLAPRKCRLCGLPVGWVFLGSRYDLKDCFQSPSLSVSGQILRLKRYQYELFP